jgi:hypothetical protein
MFPMVIIFAYLCPNQTGPAKSAAVSPFTYIASFGATWLPLLWLNPAKTLSRRVCAGMLELLIELLLIAIVIPIVISHLVGICLSFAVVDACFLSIMYIFYP